MQHENETELVQTAETSSASTQTKSAEPWLHHRTGKELLFSLAVRCGSSKYSIMDHMRGPKTRFTDDHTSKNVWSRSKLGVLFEVCFRQL